MSMLISRKPIHSPLSFDSFAITRAVNSAFNYPDYKVEKGEDKMSVLVNLAGFKKDQIDVSIEDYDDHDVLIISAASTNDEDDSKENRHGFYDRKVKLSIVLPDNLSLEDASTSYEDGILSVGFVVKEPPKKEPIKLAIS